MVTLGQRILGYTLEEVIGEGGMATIYRATNPLGKVKAVKVLKSEFTRDPDVRQRFHQEARIMVQLGEHTTHICQVDNLDITEDYVALVMEFLQGQNLATYLRMHGPVNVRQLIEWMEPVLLAIGYAHKQDVVHRDLKPANLHLMPNGQIKVLDFGISKVLNSGDDLTMTQQVIGSPRFMSPEQILTPKLVDHRSDIYSLGVTIWTLVTGRRPFEIENDTNSDFMIQNRIINDTLPLLEGNTAVLNPLIQKATAKKVGDRYQNCQLLAEDLTSVLKSQFMKSAFESPNSDFESTKVQKNPISASKPYSNNLKQPDSDLPVHQESTSVDETEFDAENQDSYQKTWIIKVGLWLRIINPDGSYGWLIIIQWLLFFIIVLYKIIPGTSPEALYERGEKLHVKGDFEDAATLYRKSAEQGYISAQLELGRLYLLGTGVGQDDKLAVEWFKKAAEQGEPSAQFLLGDAYTTGKGVTQNDSLAVEWLLKSAEQENEAAQLSLADKYHFGKGVVTDDKKAIEWYIRAAEHGSTVARNKLKELVQKP